MLRALQRTILLGLCLALLACDSSTAVATPTQVMVRINSSDSALLEQVSKLRISASLQEGSTWKAPATVTLDAAGLTWPVDLPIFPSERGDERKQFDVVVEALAGDMVLAQTRTVTGFQVGQHTVLPMTLFACPHHEPGFVCEQQDCAGADCQVCDATGQCVLAGTTVAVLEVPFPADAQVGAFDARTDATIMRTDGSDYAQDAGDAGESAVEAGPCTVDCKNACAGDADCASGSRCNLMTGACVECLGNADCADSTKPICSAESCVACSVDADCKTPGDHCSQNACAPGCRTNADCTTLHGSVCSATSNSCECQPAPATCAPDGQLRRSDSCGTFGTVSTDCCGQGCSGSSCKVPVRPHARASCHNGDLYWLDSCGTANDLVQSCCNEGCTGTACKPVRLQASKTCVGGDSHWADSCGKPGALAQSCCGAGCSNGECAANEPHATQKCNSGDVYWFDSCGAPGALVTSCAGRGCNNAKCRAACPAGMVPVPGFAVCIDAYEASFWINKSCTGTRYDRPPAGFDAYVTSGGLPASFTDSGGSLRTFTQPTVNVYACSVANVLPAIGISYFQAKRACENSGKRLCKETEWAASCSSRYPYGNTYKAGACFSSYGVNVEATGAAPECQGGVTGLYDMLGNAEEWLDCPLTQDTCHQASSLRTDQNTICTSRSNTSVRERSVYGPFNGKYIDEPEGVRCCISQ